jgi:DNA-binding transcriptional regulator YiaG
VRSTVEESPRESLGDFSGELVVGPEAADLSTRDLADDDCHGEGLIGRLTVRRLAAQPVVAHFRQTQTPLRLQPIPIWDIAAKRIGFRLVSTHSARYQALLRRLRRAREDAGLTQQQVVAQLGTYRNFLTKVESGERRLDPVELQNLARIYRRPISYFLPD